MDECIVEGYGGYGNWHEFARDALENFALDLLHANDADAALAETAERRTAAAAPEGARRKAGPRTEPSEELPAAEWPASAVEQARIMSIEETAIAAPVRTFAVENSLARVKEEPLIGLHNRDWPSIWALSAMAEVAAGGAVPPRDAYAAVTDRAWALARSLVSLEDRGGRNSRRFCPRIPRSGRGGGGLRELRDRVARA